MSLSINMHQLVAIKVVHHNGSDLHDDFVSIKGTDSEGSEVTFFCEDVNILLDMADQARDAADKLEMGSND